MSGTNAIEFISPSEWFSQSTSANSETRVRESPVWVERRLSFGDIANKNEALDRRRSWPLSLADAEHQEEKWDNANSSADSEEFEHFAAFSPESIAMPATIAQQQNRLKRDFVELPQPNPTHEDRMKASQDLSCASDSSRSAKKRRFEPESQRPRNAAVVDPPHDSNPQIAATLQETNDLKPTTAYGRLFSKLKLKASQAIAAGGTFGAFFKRVIVSTADG